MNEELLQALLEKSGLAGRISTEDFARDLQDDATLNAVLDKTGLTGRISAEQVRAELGFTNTPVAGVTDPNAKEKSKRQRSFLGNVGSSLNTGARSGISGAIKGVEAVSNIFAGESEEEIAYMNSIIDKTNLTEEEKAFQKKQYERPLAASLESFDKETEDIRGTQNYAGQGVSETFSKDGFWAGLEKTIGSIAESTPNLALTVANAPAGIAVMGTSAFGNKYDELRNQGIDNNKALATGAVVGVAEAALEALGGKIARGSIKGILGKDALEKTIKSKLVQNPVTAALFEGTGEAGVQLVDNISSHLAGANGDKEMTKDLLLQGTLDALIVGGVMGGAIATPGAIARTVRGDGDVQEDNQEVVASGRESLPSGQGVQETSTDQPSGASQEGVGETPSSLVESVKAFGRGEDSVININASADGTYTVLNNGQEVGTGELTQGEIDGLANVRSGRTRSRTYKEKIAKRLVSENTPDVAVNASSLLNEKGELTEEGADIKERILLGEDVFIINDTDIKNKDVSENLNVQRDRVFKSDNLQGDRAILEGNRVVFKDAEYNKNENGDWIKTSYKTNKTSKTPIKSKKVLDIINKKVNKNTSDSDNKLESINRLINAQEQTTQEETEELQGQPTVQEPETTTIQEDEATEATELEVGPQEVVTQPQEVVTQPQEVVTQPQEVVTGPQPGDQLELDFNAQSTEEISEIEIPSYNRPVKRNPQTGLWHRVRVSGELYKDPIKSKKRLQEIETELQKSTQDGQTERVPDNQATEITTEPTGTVDGGIEGATNQDGQDTTLQEEVQVGDGQGTVQVSEQTNQEVEPQTAEELKAEIESLKTDPMSYFDRGVDPYETILIYKRRLEELESTPKIKFSREALQLTRLNPSEEQGRRDGGEALVEAAAVVDRVENVDDPNRQEQVEALKEHAEQSGRMVPKEDIDNGVYGEFLAAGQEQRVYTEEGSNVVTKVNDMSAYDTPTEYMDALAIHNKVFPETKYTVKGFTEQSSVAGTGRGDQLSVVVEQPKVEGVPATEAEIKSDMESRGFTQDEYDSNLYISDDYVIDDISTDNVIKSEDGTFNYIDPMIGLNGPMDDFGGSRVPNDPANKVESSTPTGELQTTAQSIEEQAVQIDNLGFTGNAKRESDGSSKLAKALAYIANRITGLKNSSFAEAAPLVGKANIKNSAENQTPQTEDAMVQEVNNIISTSRNALTIINSNIKKEKDSAKRKDLVEQRRKIRKQIAEHSTDTKVKKKYSREVDTSNMISVSNNFRSGENKYVSNNEGVLARERFNIGELKLLSDGGSDRTVFDLGDGRVLKVAKNGRGLQQNSIAGDYILEQEGIIPETFEVGLNYIVTEKVDRAKSSDKIVTENLNTGEEVNTTFGKMLNDLSRFSQRDFDNKTSDLQNVMYKYGLDTLLSYDVLWGDITARRNWGVKGETPIHLDEGTFGGVQMIRSFKGKKPLEDAEFREIYNESRKLKKDFGDKDKFTKFSQENSQYYAAVVQGLESDILLSLSEAPGPSAFIHEVAGHVMERFYTPAQKKFITDQYNKWAKENKQPTVKNFDDTVDVGNLKNEPVVSEWLARVAEEYYKAGRDLSKVDMAKGMDAADRGLLQQALDVISEAIQAIGQGIKQYLGSDVNLTPEMQNFFNQQIIGNTNETQQSKVTSKKNDKGQKNKKSQATKKGTKNQAEVESDKNILENFGETKRKDCK